MLRNNSRAIITNVDAANDSAKHYLDNIYKSLQQAWQSLKSYYHTASIDNTSASIGNNSASNNTNNDGGSSQNNTTTISMPMEAAHPDSNVATENNTNDGANVINPVGTSNSWQFNLTVSLEDEGEGNTGANNSNQNATSMETSNCNSKIVSHYLLYNIYFYVPDPNDPPPSYQTLSQPPPKYEDCKK